jgi:hypothetical protein
LRVRTLLPAFGLEVVQEVQHQRRIEVGQLQRGWRLAGALLGAVTFGLLARAFGWIVALSERGRSVGFLRAPRLESPRLCGHLTYRSSVLLNVNIIDER